MKTCVYCTVRPKWKLKGNEWIDYVCGLHVHSALMNRVFGYTQVSITDVRSDALEAPTTEPLESAGDRPASLEGMPPTPATNQTEAL